MRAGVLCVGALLGALAGCGETFVEQPAPRVDGTWTEGQTVPGGSFRMTLTSSGSEVAGTGTYSGEAGPAGTVAVTGTAAGGHVLLDLELTQALPVTGPTNLEHFDGQVTSTELRGTMTNVSPTPSTPFTVVFTRQ